MEELENDVNQLEEEASSLVDQVIALKAELIKKDKIIADLHGVLVAATPMEAGFSK
tara:strand:+ start:518 stop:685 length:168 start_codon:yes stop_codon:yes gene_type:complete